MALVLKDRIKESTVTTGTGTITLDGATGAYQTFAAVGNGNVTYYAIYGQTTNEWEVGYGTYTASGTTLSRDFVYASSNAGSLVDFSAGTKDVICTYPSEQAVYQETDGSLKIINGVIEVSEDGTEGTTLPNTAYQGFATGNYYIQANLQNLSSGANASADWVITADNGTDTEFYTDLGMASSGYNYTGYSAIKANSTYLLGTGSDVRIIAGKYGAVTPGAQDIVFIAGSLEDTETRARIKGDTGNVILNNAANATDTGEKLQVVGTAKITGATTFGNTVTLNANPSTNLEAATKQYVDNVASLGIIIHPAVRVESIGNLNATYNNGTLGVGATLTNAGTQAALVLDGITLSVNDRVIVMDQTAQTENGVYTVTNTGSGSTNWVLTRATDADTYGVTNPNKLAQGSYFYIQEGDTAAGESYVCSTVGVITFGTTAITFSQFSASPAYTGTSPINVSGQTISLTGVVDELHGGTGLSAYTAGDLIYSNTTNNLTNLAIGSTGQTLIVSGGAPVWGALDMAGSGVSGVLAESHGGTNQSSYATGDMLYASATNTLAKLSPNTSTTKKWLNQTGTGSAGQAPTWDVITASDIASGVLGAANGGTGLSSYAVGDIIYASGATTLSKLSDVATGNALISGGLTTAPSWGKIGLTTHVDGVLGTANGGTGNTSGQAASVANALTAGTGLSLSSGTTYDGSAAKTLNIADTAVTAGSYTYASITVDAQGRLTAASSGASPSAFPSGTAMMFVQTSAPTGWTKSTTHDNKALRVVSGTAGSGGSVAFTTAFASQAVSGSNSSTTATNQNTTETGSISVTVGAGTLAVGAGTFAVAATTLATTQIPGHTHTVPASSPTFGGSNAQTGGGGGTITSGSTGGGGSHTHTLSGAPSISGAPSVTSQTFTANAHTHTQDAHSHTFTGTAINLAVQYVDVIIATKD